MAAGAAAVPAAKESKDLSAAGTPYVQPGGQWSKFKTYSTFQRTWDIWRFGLTFFFKLWAINQVGLGLGPVPPGTSWEGGVVSPVGPALSTPAVRACIGTLRSISQLLVTWQCRPAAASGSPLPVLLRCLAELRLQGHNPPKQPLRWLERLPAGPAEGASILCIHPEHPS